MTTLVEHARRELAEFGEDPPFAACLTATVGAYASYGHSGYSHEDALDLLTRLLRREALTPLSADPDEWNDRSAMSGTPLWQSDRDTRAFSTDGGRTYTLTGDPEKKVHRSVVPKRWRLLLRDKNGLRSGQAIRVAYAYLELGPISDADQAALDRLDQAGRQRYAEDRWHEGAPLGLALYCPTPHQPLGEDTDMVPEYAR